ncbi:DNA-deoxyinosine glycosylase [Dysgonomonas massiliensis]|uniref:DNA-deoxyinosine glycosylase n=1 Tax=Dysgonomonas massiliensis TaxID=2040292 RepID=UPI000C77DFA5|nr:DNA-deoxyinosine glycosylase [Dysgonomonas massiliensis]
MSRKTAFPPIVDQHTKILMLGTMPSEESLKRQEYYGNPKNQFWTLLFTVYKQPFVSDYRERVAFLHEQHIGIWDVLQSCEGEGSLDSKIKNERANDFSTFFERYPQIESICFTSKKAEQFYKKYVGLDNQRSYFVLSSPSPANARMSFAEKSHQWRDLLERILSLP